MARNSGQIAAVPARAASTCSQTLCRRQISPIRRNGSKPSDDVVPAVAQTKKGRRPAATFSGNGLGQAIGPHGPLVVSLDPAKMVAPQSGDAESLFDRGMGLRRGVRDQLAARYVRPTMSTWCPSLTGHSRPLPRGQDRAQRADEAESWIAPPPRSSKRNRSGRPSASTSQSRTRVSNSVQAGLVDQSIPRTPKPEASRSPQDRRPRVVAGEVGEEIGRLPMRDSRQDEFVDIAENRRERLALLRRPIRQAAENFSRLDLREHGQLLDLFHVVGDPVDDFVAVAAEFVGGHDRVTLLSLWLKRMIILLAPTHCYKTGYEQARSRLCDRALGLELRQFISCLKAYNLSERPVAIALGSHAAVGPQQLRLNLGGEAEASDVINQQPEWSHLGIPASRTGLTFQSLLQEGTPFLFCENHAMPFPDDSVDEVLTNGVPIDRKTFLGPGISSSEIRRILKSGSCWIDNGVVVYTKP